MSMDHPDDDYEQTEPEFDTPMGEAPELTPEEWDQLQADIYDDRREHMDRDEGRHR